MSTLNSIASKARFGIIAGFAGWLVAVAPSRIIAQSETVQKSPHVPTGYGLIWNDEFDGKTLDTGKWQYRQLGKRQNSVVSKESVSLDGKGLLQLTTFKKDDTIHVGMIGTQDIFEQQYGYFESRIKFERMQGHHGAFWLQSPTYGKIVDDPGKSGAEIDIIEFFGVNRKDREAAVNIYWNPYKPKPAHNGPRKLDLEPILGKAGKSGEPMKKLCDDFHIYALLWTNKEYVFSIDGKEVYRTSEGLSHRTQYIILSLLCSDWERKRLDDTKLPESMAVDYVRVYAKDKRPRD